MTITIDNLNAGLEALNLPKATAENRKHEAQEKFRVNVADKGMKPDVAVRTSLEIALKGITSNRDARLKAAKHAAGVTMTSRTQRAASTVTSNLPKRKPTQSKPKKTPPSHWSHSDLKLGIFLALFWLIALAIILIVSPPLYNSYNAEFGVGAGTGAVTGLVVGLIAVTFLVNVGIRSLLNNRHPRPVVPLSSDKDLKEAGVTK